MKVLAVDPGLTLGYAVIEDGILKESGNIDYGDLEESILVKYSEEGDLAVVIEETPTPTNSPLDRKLQLVLGWLRHVFPSATWISPGIWKQNRSIINLPVPNIPGGLSEKPSPHQRDSYRLGMYYLIIYLAQETS